MSEKAAGEETVNAWFAMQFDRLTFYEMMGCPLTADQIRRARRLLEEEDDQR